MIAWIIPIIVFYVIYFRPDDRPPLNDTEMEYECPEYFKDHYFFDDTIEDAMKDIEAKSKK